MKISDCARIKLDELEKFYLVIFGFIFVITFLFHDTIIVLSGSSSWLLIVSFLLFLLFSERIKVIKDNRRDMNRKLMIEVYQKDTANNRLVIKEKLLDKKLTFASFANEEEISQIIKNDFWFKFSLNNNKTHYNLDVFKEVKTDVRCLISFGDGDFIKIEELDCLMFLPNQAKMEAILVQIFGAIILEYRSRKDVQYSISDHTLNTIDNIHKKANEYISSILLKNYQDVLKIFSSKEEFKISGITIEKNGKKLLIATAVKTETQYIVLLPTETIASLFSAMQDIVN